MKMNLREALHMVKLRTMPQGPPDYRFIGQEMWRKIKSVHSVLAEAGKFFDWQKYRLGRAAIRDADGVQEVGDGISCGGTWYVGLTDFAGKDGKAFLPSCFA